MVFRVFKDFVFKVSPFEPLIFKYIGFSYIKNRANFSARPDDLRIFARSLLNGDTVNLSAVAVCVSLF